MRRLLSENCRKYNLDHGKSSDRETGTVRATVECLSRDR